jgi:cell wall-associated NlpC family hydrolase
LNCAKEGDLVFFGENKITHVGILINKNEVIHAFGKVRIDKINENGIINNENKELSHRLICTKTFQ